ncbi:hypothetical protein BGZ76_004620 [Entomortierella beljakovae]|nr:hypothetical protein BGZ76_004620 [Entomortierella beljakovae]
MSRLNWVTKANNASFPTFVEEFGYEDREMAARDYCSLMENKRLKGAIRDKLLADYSQWISQDPDLFWLERENAKKSRNSIALLTGSLIGEASSSAQATISRSKTMAQSNIQAKLPKTWPPNDHSTTAGCVEDEEIEITCDQLSSAKSTPFYGLIYYLFRKKQGKRSILPAVPRVFSSLNFQEMFTYVKAELEKAEEGDPWKIREKDALVILSGIINTLSPEALETFTIAPTIKEQSLIPSLEVKHPLIEALIEDLLSALCPGISADPYAESNIWSLQTRVWNLLLQSGNSGSIKTKDEKANLAVLQIMSHLCALLSTNQLSVPSSEHVYVSLWSFVMNMLFGGQSIRAIPGELASSATKDARSLMESEFGLTNKYVCGRKVDLSVRMYTDFNWDEEICIFEFKSINVSDELCKQQQRKSVRINGAILLDLEKKGVDISRVFPIIAEGRGCTLDLYTLRRYDDVLGAGRSSLSSIWLPSSEAQLKPFLRSNSLQMLLAFSEHTKRFAMDVRDVFSSNPITSLPQTPPQNPVSDPFILFTPSKSNKRAKTA